MADGEEYEGFEWDPEKSDINRAARGFDFAAAALVFSDDYLESEDLRRDYGEQRFVVTGDVGGGVITVVWTPRGRRRRIISARPASERERHAYREAIQRPDSEE